MAAMLAIGLGAGPAQAGLLGDSIRVTYRFPDINTVRDSAGVLVVAPTASGGLVDTFGGGKSFLVTLSDTQIVLDVRQSGGVFNADGTFNGVRLDNLTKPFDGVTLNPATNLPGFNADRVITSGNMLGINLGGLGGRVSQVVLDVASPVAAVPEPRMLGLLLLALGAMTLVRARRMA